MDVLALVVLGLLVAGTLLGLLLLAGLVALVLLGLVPAVLLGLFGAGDEVPPLEEHAARESAAPAVSTIAERRK